MGGQQVQQFERLIRLDDEELISSQDDATQGHDDSPEKDSCTLPMIPGSGPRSQKNDIANYSPGGFSFTVNGRHIQMNAEQLKYMSLITLTVQNAALNLTMRAARTQQEQFSTSVAVTVAEFLKLFTCILILAYEELSLSNAFKTLKLHLVDNYIDTLKVAVPSFVYYVQNNLLYVGSTHLDAATCHVTYQLKLFTTAIFSVLMLQKKLSKIQWASLIVLFCGVATIEWLAITQQAANHHHSSYNVDEPATTPMPKVTNRNESPAIGFMAILVACLMSGFAGVYFERILKGSSHISLWIRNIQLSVLSIPFGLIQVLIIDRHDFTDKGYFHGFTSLTWVCIILQVQGGLLVALVVKFANNILKGFATGMAIVISTVGSIFLFNFHLSFTFLLGVSFVISSIMMYNSNH